MRTISIKLPEPLLKRLEEEAKARGLSKSSLIRESLESTFKKSSTGSTFDAASHLVGCLRGAPKDLATDPGYLKGFGE
jgi:metal-responsive CopG/Arc/MetJ family transcriptional regulator